MLTEQELVEAIKICEASKSSYNTCQKLATFYTVYDHMFKRGQPPSYNSTKNVFAVEGESDFIKAAYQKNDDQLIQIFDELMEALRVVNPRLYDGVMRRMAE